MNRKGLWTVVLLMVATVCMATDTDALKKQINSIKKSSQYIYAEATAATEAEAKGLAEEILYEEINAWVNSKKKLREGGSNIVVSNKKELWTTLSLPRGNMHRAFIYVKKSDIQTTAGTEVIQTTPPPAPAVEPAATGSTVTPIYPDAVMQVAGCTEYNDMVNKVKELKAQGKIGHYGRYSSLERPEIYYLAIYNTAGKVVAVLTPGTDRTNVRTGSADKVTNYSGCGAIGFTVN